MEEDLAQLVDATVMKEFTSETIRDKVRRICMKDRLLYEKSIKAFVSFAQFYRKHDCSLLFKIHGESMSTQMTYAYTSVGSRF